MARVWWVITTSDKIRTAVVCNSNPLKFDTDIKTWKSTFFKTDTILNVETDTSTFPITLAHLRIFILRYTNVLIIIIIIIITSVFTD